MLKIQIVREPLVVAVGQLIVPWSSFQRPADTTAYASGDIVANSTTAAALVPLVWNVSRPDGKPARSIYIRRGLMVKRTGTQTITNSSFRLHIHRMNPVLTKAPTNGDNGAWLTAYAEHLDYIDITVDQLFNDGFSQGCGVPGHGSEISHELKGAKQLFGILEARAAYTPLSAEIYDLGLEIFVN